MAEKTPAPAQAPTADDYKFALENALDNPDLQAKFAELDAADAEADAAADPEPPKDDGFSPWEWVKGKAKKFADAPLAGKIGMAWEVPHAGITSSLSHVFPEGTKNVTDAVVGGISKAINEGTKTAVEAGAWALSKTPIGNRDDFRKWYAKTSNEWNLELPGTDLSVLASKEHMDKWAGKREGAYGFLEGVTQFTTGMVAAGGVLKGLGKAPGFVGTGARALDKTNFTKSALQGAAADITFFDPYEARLSNLLTEGPDWFTGPLNEYLEKPFKKVGGTLIGPFKADEDDGRLVARFKAAGEGFVTGTVLEGLLLVAKAVRFKRYAKEAKLSEAEQAKELGALQQELERLSSDAVADGPAKANGNTVELIPEFDITEFDPSQGVPAQSIDDIFPESATVVVKDGNKYLRIFESLAEGKRKVFDLDLSDPKAGEHIWEMKKAKPEVVVPREVAAQFSPEDWKQLEPIMFPRPEPDYQRASTMGPDKTPRDKEGTGLIITPATPEPVSVAPGPAAAAPEPAAVAPDAMPTNARPDGLSGPDTNAATPRRKAAKKNVVKTVQNEAQAQSEAAVFNLAAKNVAKEGEPFITKETQDAFMEAIQGFRDGQDPRQAAELLERYGFNPGYIQQPEHVVQQLKALVDVAPEASHVARDLGRTWDEVRKEAEKLFPELNNDGALAHAKKMFGDTDRLPEMLLATRAWMWFQAKQLAKLSRLAELNPENAVLADQHMAALNTLFQVHAHVTGAQTRTAQALNIMKHPLGELTEKLSEARKSAPVDDAVVDTAKTAESSSEKVVDSAAPGHRAPGTYPVVANMSKREIQAMSRQLAMAGDDLDVMLKIITGPKNADLGMHPKVPTEIKRSFGKFVNTYRAEAMLSGIPTHVGNFLSTLGMGVLRPSTMFFAGLESMDKALADEGKDILAGLFVSWAESAKLASRAFLDGRGILDGSSSLERMADDLLPLERASLKHGAEALGAGIHILSRMPSRLLLSADEFFKQLSYRANVRAQVLKQARAEGITDPKVLKQRAVDSMLVAFDPNGGATFPNALKYAKEVTFTDDLTGTSKLIQDAINSNEILKFIIPFYKTPVNIFSHVWEMTPGLNMLNKKMVEDLAAGGQRAALARAKADFGAMMYAMAATLAVSGTITGRGPMDPELRKQWMAAGYQPYSIRIGDKQISYRRGDPFTAALGLVADVVSMSGEADLDTKKSMAAVAIAASAANVTSKTYMQGLSDFLNAIASGQVRNFETFVGSAVASFAPNLTNRANTDEYIREARDVVDAFGARIPGWSESLPARRNIFGEKVTKAPGWANRAFNPFTVMDVPKDDNVAVELLKLGKALPMPPETWADGRIDLTNADLYLPDPKVRPGAPKQSPYDRWLEMMADPPWGGPNLRQVVEQVVRSEAYQQLKGENAWGPGGARHMMVSNYIRGFQDNARARLVVEYPKLLQDLVANGATTEAGILQGRSGAKRMQEQMEQMFQQ